MSLGVCQDCEWGRPWVSTPGDTLLPPGPLQLSWQMEAGRPHGFSVTNSHCHHYTSLPPHPPPPLRLCTGHGRLCGSKKKVDLLGLGFHSSQKLRPGLARQRCGCRGRCALVPSGSFKETLRRDAGGPWGRAALRARHGTALSPKGQREGHGCHRGTWASCIAVLPP